MLNYTHFFLLIFHNIILIMDLTSAKKIIQKLPSDTIIFLKKSYNFINDQNFLFAAYSKALKNKTYRLYVNCILLISEKRHEINSEELKKMSDCDKEDLMKGFETLLKFGLVQISIGADNNLYIVFLPEARLPEIQKNPKLLRLFKENLTPSQFEKVFCNGDPFSYVQKENVEETSNFIDFNAIELKMMAAKKKNISIDEECKNYLTGFDFTEDQIISLLNQSLIEHPEMFTVSKSLLKEEATKLANILLAEATKREFYFDQKIFEYDAHQMQGINLEQIKKTCEDYKPLEFFSNIAKKQLTQKEIDFLSRIDPTLGNAKINLAIALGYFCKNNKTLNEKYLTRVFETLAQNLNWTFEDALKYWNHAYKPELRKESAKLF